MNTDSAHWTLLRHGEFGNQNLCKGGNTKKMKKKTLTIAIALVLVVALAVGATWAYLTSTTNTITNTFVAGKLFDQGGGIKLQEKAVTQKADGTYVIAADAAWQDTGIEYVVQPGVDLPKQPAVKVTDLTAKAYLFVGVKGDTKDGFTWNVDTAIWSPLMKDNAQVEKDGYKIWVLTGNVENGSYDILANDKVTVGKDLNPDTLTAANNIAFQAYICQAAGFADAAAAFTECF